MRGDIEEKIGLTLQIILSSVQKCARLMKDPHLVWCFEGRSWRKDIYSPYKRNRTELREKNSAEQNEEDRRLYEAFNDLQKYIVEKTNCTTLQHNSLEADDCIAGWVQLHPEDQHLIVSSDADFYQLLTSNVRQYNGMTDQIITLDGIFDNKNKPVIDKKTSLPKPGPNPKWEVFEKAIRGCTSDNVFSAYPGVRLKSSKKKIGLIEAFEDREKQGYSYNNFMLQRWTDHENIEHRVLDDYNRNIILVDLTKQPDNIKQLITETINAQTIAKKVPMVGAHFLKFCGKYQLLKLSEFASNFATILSRGYEAQ